MLFPAHEPDAPRLAPKVHPLTREVEPEDPMELVAMSVHGDPDVMLECIVQEFAGMGWAPDELLPLFASPHYPVLNQLRALLGPEALEARLRSILGRVGVFQVVEQIDVDVDDDDEFDHDHDHASGGLGLVQITPGLPRSNRAPNARG